MTAFAVSRLAAGPEAELVVVTGRVGPLESDDVAEALSAAGRDGARRVVVDLADASVEDPGALAGLYELARVLRVRGGIVVIAAPPRHELREVLAATGVDQAFTLYDSRRAALDDLDLDC